MSVLYQGLSSRSKFSIVLAAFFVVLTNMVFAAYVMLGAVERLAFGETDRNAVIEVSSGLQGSNDSAVLRAHAIQVLVNLKMITNKHAVVVVAIAGAFSLLAIGFVLFVIGIDGAFTLQAESPGSNGRLLLTGSAPGLACFFLSFLVLVIGIFHRSQLTVGEVRFATQEPPAPVEKSTGIPDLVFHPNGQLQLNGK